MRRYVLLVAALLFLAQVVQAQQARPPRGGFWYGFGLGAGAIRISCDLCLPDTHAGAVATLRIGGSPSRRLRVGLEATGWGEPSGELRRREATLGLAAQWRLAPGSRWLLLGSTGASWLRISEADDALTATAPFIHLGVSHEIPLAPAYAIAPTLGVSRSFGGVLRLDGSEVTRGAGVTRAQVGLNLLLY
jgi:hypothetical protein